MTEKIKGILNFLLRIGFSTGLLWFIFSKIDTQKTVEVIKSADMNYIVLAGVVYLILNFILLGRWIIYLRAMDVRVSKFQAVRYFFIGLFGNLFLPSAMGGDLLKIYGMCKGSDKKTAIVASVLLDRLSGFASIVIVAVTAFIFGYQYIQDIALLWSIVVMAAVSMTVALILFNEKIYSFGCRIFTFVPKVKDVLMKLHYDISLMKGKKHYGYIAILLSCLSQSIYAFEFFLIAHALHQDFSLIYFLIFVPLTCVAASVPSIGGLGVREAGVAFLFAKIGMESGVAVSISLISFLYVIIMGLLGGLFYVTTLHTRRL